ncbi:unnamed protein product (macronuclear) [Paramecium tetraurelia]|uniref:Uncharacterized protein n=1 Tax=Paramecium tetraurelia TaxID=5888 RepID=A0DD65_PARTE|nr:uncharacterized protein GSPATT00015841001 [Paramecium tetraurelia]CAK80982.1 unnamed protein product [Paramecium tetraurelia]|eukprot:XP_001448379.1 hypothetical protein (macronuclear) [Paramecium tetraurelia strain d4-2]
MTDLKLWKKKQRIDDSVKMFIIVLGYGDIAKALLYRGWVKNPNSVSPCFDFKFRNRLQQFIRILDCESLSQVYMFNHQSWIMQISKQFNLVQQQIHILPKGI